MAGTTDSASEGVRETGPHDAVPAPAASHDGNGPAPATQPAPASSHTPATKRSHPWRRGVLLVLVLVGLVYAGVSLVPTIKIALNTISTDDAYVNGHVTFVAPRVRGQVTEVLVDDNYRVKQGDVLVRLDREPYEIQRSIRKTAVATAETALATAKADTRSLVAQAGAARYRLDHAIEDVHTQTANLRSSVATYKSRTATLALAEANLKRGEELAPAGGISKEELDQRRQTVKVDQAAVDQALQDVFATRVGLGLAAQPERGHELGDVPDNLDQTFSTVRQALYQLTQTMATLGYTPSSWKSSPKQVVDEFYKQDPEGNLDRIIARLVPTTPAVKQAEAKLEQARADLAQAELDLRYCDVLSEIDGVVTRRNVNPGNNVSAGQSLMAVRSLREIWIDANFKETQLADLRLGQRVRVEVDMYGGRHEFEGRITGFTMGTGQTLALLPPQNATGNFVKIVQRLPVRIELTDYDPDKMPLFVGLSVVPYVYYKERATGPHAGEVLQPLYPLPRGPGAPTAKDTAQPVAPGPKVPVRP